MDVLLYAACAVGTGLTVLYLLVRYNGYMALLWHDFIYERLKDFLTGTSRPERILKHVQKTAVQGDPLSVVNAIDDFCKKKEWAMNVGDEKGQILDREVSKANPDIVLELGTYCGYSTLRIARLLKPGARLLTVEFNPAYAKVAREIIHFAGADDKVTLLEGSSEDIIPQLKKKHDVDTFAFIFLDHWKDRYVLDTQLMEKCGLLRKGTVLLADNVTCPGCPEYLEYVRNSPSYKSEYFLAHLEYTQAPDGLEKSVFLG
ncbi:catechol O-methyltransferase A-like isoform X1 [Protopterus annectens]|uniref:catechol O-methyltransferase A-like isoform X1 n=1 Tax=Protopterus annectens TaxID=7888 RepID=UPI001CFC1A9C|nr:catechol O-methyltransferase A-like isoform X1 [Protopterus annectens]XP_043936694.1 catechol O-methyltransferase A-like isoform X1 [Protopterus annectens]XP_043936695.1 catechol O-methyltransferase A-like isoform X1 [Protopterus annectens]XP_043936696.1 catechol O-methyltransferase A-like isoform X1 [Protopterus annectens]